MAKETRKEHVARKLWLQYFNRTLRHANIITEQEYLAMSRAIGKNMPRE